MRRKRLRLFLLVIMFGFVGGVGYKVAEQIWLMKSREFQKNPAKFLDYIPEAALQIKDFHRSQIEDGRTTWEVFGDEARYLKEKKELVVKKPRLFFYQKPKKDGRNDNGSDTVEVSGEEGRLWINDQKGEMERMELQGKVRVSYSGFVLNSEEVMYLKSKNQITLPGKVAIKAEGMELEGVGMQIALDEERLRLLAQVKTKIEPERLKNNRVQAGAETKNGL